MSENIDEFWEEKSEEVKGKIEGSQAEDDEGPQAEDDEEGPQADSDDDEEGPQAEDDEEGPQADSDEEGEDRFFVSTYRTKEATEKGIKEKDSTIERLKSELLLEKSRSGVKSPEPQPRAAEPQMTREEYFELLDDIEEREGSNAKTLRLVSDVIDAKWNQLKQEEARKANEYAQYSSELREKYGETVGESEIREMYDLAVQIKTGHGNPVELLMIDKARKLAKSNQQKANLDKNRLLQQRTKKAASSLRMKPGQFDPGKHTPNAKIQEKIAAAIKAKDVGAFLDATYEQNKPQGTGKRSL